MNNYRVQLRFMLKNIFINLLNSVKDSYKNLFFSGNNIQDTVDINPDTIDYYIAGNKRVYAIGDIHGCDDLLKKALEKMILDSLNHLDKHLIFIGLGDYVDRGSNSKNVIELLLTKIPAHFEKVFIKGNHELYMLGFINDPQKNVAWLDFGGRETLISYGVKPPMLNKSDLKRAALELETNLPNTHFDFLKNLQNSHVIDDYFFVHAGIDPDFPYDNQSELALTTIRAKFINYTGNFYGKKIIHGHTPIENPDLQKHRVNLDTGAYLTGNLTIGIFEHNRITIL
jgi:serine/threonine protein phosphatase 1